MRVLIFSQHFTPEITAARARVHAFAKGLAARGDDVEVICEVPNHPEGVVREGYRGRPSVQKELDGFSVRYVWVKTSPHKTTRNRLLLYGTYAAMAATIGCAARRPDVIFASSPPLPVGSAAAIVAARHRVPWVFDVRDLWPEVAVALGELSNPRLIRLAERLERRLYASATAITTVTEPFRATIAAGLPDPGKVSVIPNGTTRIWLEAGEAEVARSELGLSEDGAFLWTYAGNVGLAQGLEAAIEAAAALGDGYRLLILGQGPALAALRERAAGLPPGQVVFQPPVEPELAARYLRASDALLVPLDSRPALRDFVPSKLFDCCAVGRPVILAADGEARRLTDATGAALPVPPGDGAALAGAVSSLRADPALRERLAVAGRDFARQYERERHAERLAALLDSIV
ncbi:MAG: hypothetical protein QOG09_94 [Solirubrobacterales bacterium]|jgi:glycosyltransferase involved in cell wall biosynthesis|nr:hypothetical protein [Solirubrobacterales bacterium]